MGRNYIIGILVAMSSAIINSNHRRDNITHSKVSKTDFISFCYKLMSVCYKHLSCIQGNQLRITWLGILTSYYKQGLALSSLVINFFMNLYNLLYYIYELFQIKRHQLEFQIQFIPTIY